MPETHRHDTWRLAAQCYIVRLLHCYIYDFSTHIETLKYLTSPTNQSIGTVGDEKAIGQS